jgi:hypothetical protein
VSINGGSPVPYFNPTDPATQVLTWTQFTIPFTATGPTIVSFFNGGAATINTVSALDNVSIADAPPSATVPGPLPFLGVGSAFVWSRSLRKRIKGQR